MFDDILGEKKTKGLPPCDIDTNYGKSGSLGWDFPDSENASSTKKAKVIDLFDLLKNAVHSSPNIRRDILRTFYQHLENVNEMDKGKEKKEEFIGVA